MIGYHLYSEWILSSKTDTRVKWSLASIQNSVPLWGLLRTWCRQKEFEPEQNKMTWIWIEFRSIRNLNLSAIARTNTSRNPLCHSTLSRPKLTAPLLQLAGSNRVRQRPVTDAKQSCFLCLAVVTCLRQKNLFEILFSTSTALGFSSLDWMNCPIEMDLPLSIEGFSWWAILEQSWKSCGTVVLKSEVQSEATHLVEANSKVYMPLMTNSAPPAMLVLLVVIFTP